MTTENISRSNLHERMLPTPQGSNLQSPDHQLYWHPTEQFKMKKLIFSYFSKKLSGAHTNCLYSILLCLTHQNCLSEAILMSKT